jgi:DNA-binding transcriptional MerR regulator
MSVKQFCQIGILSKEAGASVDTVRYYEKLGLLEKPVRSVGGFRLYPTETVKKLRFIKKAQALGLTLREIKQIMRFSKRGLKPCCDLVRGIFTKKIGEFESKIGELQRMKRNLERLLSEWVAPRDTKKRSFAVCPQIERTRTKKADKSR